MPPNSELYFELELMRIEPGPEIDAFKIFDKNDDEKICQDEYNQWAMEKVSIDIKLDCTQNQIVFYFRMQ